MKTITWIKFQRSQNVVWLGHHYHMKQDQATLLNVVKHLILSKSAISSRSNWPKSEKWPKTYFLTRWIIQKCIFVIFEWSSMSDIIAKLLEIFCIVWICKMKSIWLAKPEKLTQNWQDHSKIIYLFYGKLRKKRSRFFLDMRFSRWVQKKSQFSF